MRELIAQHPDVTSVEPVDLGLKGRVLRVSCSDGVITDLLITNMSPPGGDMGDEKIVPKSRV